MILKQYYLSCLAHASYLIGDEETGTALVVDPQRDVERYIEDARCSALDIRHVFLTHFHADFIAGHLELRERAGATIYLGARAQAEYAFTPMKDGDVLELGKVRVKVLETPGHTVESISLLVYDLQNDKQNPKAVLTGDTLFVGDVGRPDLRASLGWSATQLARMLYDSLHGKLLTLPDETLVYPAHGAGSLCGRNLSTETVSTIGEQRRSNYALQSMSADEFIKLVTADQPEPPAYFTYDAVLNSKERPALETVLRRELQGLTVDQVLKKQSQDAQILDVREPGDFAKAHLAGSVNIGLGGQYATWAGTMLSREFPIVIVAEPGREEEAAVRLGRIGFDCVAGFLDGGFATLEARKELLAGTDRITALEFAREVAAAKAPLILDVRTAKEWQEAHIDKSVNVPLNHLRERLRDLPRDRKIFLHCASGYRSSIAASILQQHGLEDLTELAGGLGAWQAARLGVRPAA